MNIHRDKLSVYFVMVKKINCLSQFLNIFFAGSLNSCAKKTYLIYNLSAFITLLKPIWKQYSGV